MTSFKNPNFARSDGADVLVVPDSLLAPRLARAWLTSRLADLSTSVVSNALVLTSELVTNAVLHGQPDVAVTLQRHRSALRVEVADREPTMPTFPDQRLDPTRVSGRGLFIVTKLATNWGVDRLDAGSGKSVWFTMNLA